MNQQGPNIAEKPPEKYDFKNPKRIASEEKETLQLIHQNYALIIEKLLGSMLKVDVKVEHQETEQQIFSEYLKGLNLPTCIGVVEMPELNGYAIFEVNSPLIYSAVNRLLGGKGNIAKVSRPFTELELSIAAKVINSLLEELTSAWRVVGNLTFKLKDLHVNPAFAKITPDREICITNTFKVTLGDTPGLITLCIPYSNLEPLLNEVTDKSSGYQVEASPEIMDKLKNAVEGIEFLLTVVLGSTQLKMEELLGLQIGDILKLSNRASEPLIGRIEGIEKFHVKPGLLGKYKAITIEDEITQSH